MTGIIDADTHIAESEGMWRLFDQDMYRRRPVMVAAPDDTLYRDFNVLWLIDGNIFPKAAGKGGFRIITPTGSKRETGRTDISLVAVKLPTSMRAWPTWTRPTSPSR
jgi:hypothetical protein